MKLATSIIKTPAIVVVLMIGLCVALSTFGFMSWGTPKVRAFVDAAVARYDTYFPEITLESGHASIKKHQPYYVDFGQGKNAPIIIDTRKGFEGAALDYLKGAEEGFVLTNSTLVVKNKGETRIVPLANIPDFVLNSATIRSLIDEYFHRIVAVVAVFVAVYFLFSKSFQVLMFALIPFVWARVRAVPLSYGQALKGAGFCMVPPVVLTVLQDLFGVVISGRFLVYFGLYLALTICLSVVLTRGTCDTAEPSAGITP
jgi:hypothetical protein